MNKKIIGFCVLMFLFFGGADIGAASTSTVYSQVFGVVTAVGSSPRSVTLGYAQPAIGACLPTPSGDCAPGPAGRYSDKITQGQVLVINGMGSVISDISDMKVGDSIVGYLRDDVIYAVKDSSLFPAGCNPLTGVCSGSGTVSGGSAGGSTGGSNSGTTVYPPGGTTEGGVSGGGQSFIKSDLSLGSQGSEVVTLQSKLKSLGYFPASVQATGYFGQVTKEAVIQYQVASGILPTGFVGPLTRDELGY